MVSMMQLYGHAPCGPCGRLVPRLTGCVHWQVRTARSAPERMALRVAAKKRRTIREMARKRQSRSDGT